MNKCGCVMVVFLLLSACGTVSRMGIGDFGKNTHAVSERGQSFYNPYKPYYQAVAADGDMLLPVCVFTIVGCPLVLIDVPISFVTDTLVLPYDFARGAYIQHYNNKHTSYEYYGPFIFKYRSMYKTGDFLDIYHGGNQQAITSEGVKWEGGNLILSYQAKILEKRLKPAPALLIKDRFGAIFLLAETPTKDFKLSRIADDPEWVVLAGQPSWRVYYRKLGEAYISAAYTMFSPGWMLNEAKPDSYNIDTVIDDRDLSIISIPHQQPPLTCSNPEHKATGQQKPCIIQKYLLSLSPDQKQAVYLANTGQLWIAKEQTYHNLTALPSEQQQALRELLTENVAKEERYLELRDEDQQLAYKKDSLQLYRAYLAWFNKYYKWQQQATEWQLVELHKTK